MSGPALRLASRAERLGSAFPDVDLPALPPLRRAAQAAGPAPFIGGIRGETRKASGPAAIVSDSTHLGGVRPGTSSPSGIPVMEAVAGVAVAWSTTAGWGAELAAVGCGSAHRINEGAGVSVLNETS